MTITFSAILFAILIMFNRIKKNSFFVVHIFILISLAYFLEFYVGIKAKPFGKGAFMMFTMLHLFFINIVTFCAYGRDKKLAQRREWRIPEIQLHTLELLGGVVGAVLGQKIFKHKSKKRTYKATFYGIIAIQLGVICYILKALNIW